MKKKYFTIDEATAWLFESTGDKFSREDVLLENEAGHLPIYFRYRGHIGTFLDYTDSMGVGSIVFPKPTQRFYIKGTLKSLSVCDIGVITETIRLRRTTSGIPILNESKSKSDILRPHAVVPFEIIHSYPEINTIKASGTFWGRVRESAVYTADERLPNGQIVRGRRIIGQIAYYLNSTSEIPESAWRFHIEDLTRLKVEITSLRSEAQNFPSVDQKPASNTPKPWLKLDPRDPDPIQAWYTPARYFARELAANDATLLEKQELLAQKIVPMLSKVKIFKRGGKMPLSASTIKKALSNLDWS